MTAFFQIILSVLGALCFVVVIRTSPGLRTLAKLRPLTRRTFALAGAFFLFGAALLTQERRTDFTRATEYDRLQQSRKIAAALSVFAIASYCWDVRRANIQPNPGK